MLYCQHHHKDFELAALSHSVLIDSLTLILLNLSLWLISKLSETSNTCGKARASFQAVAYVSGLNGNVELKQYVEKSKHKLTKKGLLEKFVVYLGGYRWDACTLKENTFKVVCTSYKRPRDYIRNGKGLQILDIQVSGEIRNFCIMPCNEFTPPTVPRPRSYKVQFSQGKTLKALLYISNLKWK